MSQLGHQATRQMKKSGAITGLPTCHANARHMKEGKRMKKLLSLLVFTLLAAFVLPAAAQQSTGPYTCTGPAIATGTIGTQSGAAPNPQYITAFYPIATEPYAIDGFTNFGGPTKLSFGAASGARLRFGSQCTTSGGACVAPPAGRFITLSIGTTFVIEQTPNGQQSVAISVWKIGGVKVMELYGLSAVTSLQSTQTFSDGISVVRQDTGANSDFWFEGWNTVNGVTSWKSVKAKFVSNQCGSI